MGLKPRQVQRRRRLRRLLRRVGLGAIVDRRDVRVTPASGLPEYGHGLLDGLALAGPPVLVSIGAGIAAEGSQNLDPVGDFLSRGVVEAAVLFEPQPDRAEQLRRRFGHIVGVRVVEAAVGGDREELTLWRVRPEHRALITSETFDVEGGRLDLRPPRSAAVHRPVVPAGR